MSALTRWSEGYDDFVLSQTTPSIVYDMPKIRRTAEVLRALCAPFGAECYFSVKANRTPAVLAEFARWGFGADVASGEELAAAVQAGHGRFVATAPGLPLATMFAITARGGLIFFDSVEQVRQAFEAGLDISAQGARVSIPGLYERFGLTLDEISDLEGELGWTPRRLHFHYGEIGDMSRLKDLLGLAQDAALRFKSTLVDLGGGYGALSNDMGRLHEAFQAIGAFSIKLNVRCAFELGKVAVSRSASLVAQVLSVKQRGALQLITLDACAYNLGTLERRSLRYPKSTTERTIRSVIAGPTCYEGDVFLEASLPPLKAGDKMVLGLCGGYATSLAGSLHGLPPPQEIYFG